jgi:HTH-type transcriptional regulator, cell division transcriptional repressor
VAKRTPIPGSIGERIRARRTALGMTQTALSEAAGIGQSAISSAETGDTAWLQGPNLLNMAKALSVAAAWLQTGSGDMQRPVAATTEDGVVIDLLRALSEPNRAAWLAAGSALLNAQDHRPPSVSDPYPIRKSGRKQPA